MTNTNTYTVVARQFLRNLLTPNLYLDILTSIKNPMNKELSLLPPKKTGLGGKSQILVSDEATDNNFDFLAVEDSKMGAWQAVLLKKSIYVLPLWWHANYEEIAFVFENKDISLRRKGFYFARTDKRNKVNREEIIRSLQNQNKSVEPTVEKIDNTYLVSFCYWNDWSGLINEQLTVTIKNGKPIFGESHKDILYKYNCGILF